MNKKYLYNTLLVATLSLFVFNCASSGYGDVKKGPKWYTSRQTSPDYYYGFGMAKKANPSLALRVATARAREEVASQISVKVESMIEDVMESSGIGESEQSINFSSYVSKQIVSKTLEGTVTEKSDQSNDGTYYVMVSYSIKNAKNAILEAANREEALFNEFKAKQGLDRLENAVNRLDATN